MDTDWMFEDPIDKEHKEYNTVISFGDNDNPGYYASRGDKCNFKVQTLYSLHTDKNSDNVTGYAKSFTPKTTIKVRNWINTINK